MKILLGKSLLMSFFLVQLSCCLFVSSVVFADTDMHLIYVNGVAEKTVDPNIVLLQVESWAKALSAKQAQEQQALQYATITSAIVKFKIKKEDVQTEGFSVYPEYTYDQKTQSNKMTGYKVSHRVKITYRKVDGAGALLDSLVTSKSDIRGINIQSVFLDYDNKSVLENSLLNEAVKNARAKAEMLTTAADVIIKAVHRIQFSSDAPPIAEPMYEKAAMRAMSDSVSPPTELSSGKIKLRVEVQMQFEI